jgi:hypothetical protein
MSQSDNRSARAAMEDHFEVLRMRLETLESELARIDGEVGNIWKLLTGKGNGGTGMCSEVQKISEFVVNWKDRQKQIRNAIIAQGLVWAITTAIAVWKLILTSPPK